MADTFTTRCGFRKMEVGTHNNDWGATHDVGLDEEDQALKGQYSRTISGDETLSQSQNNCTIQFMAGSPAAAFTVTVLAVECWWIVQNNTGKTCSWKTASGAAASIPTGQTHIVRCGGTDCFSMGKLS